MSPVLKFSDVSLVRNGKRILDNLNWQVDPNQRWVVLGNNGAGKTTALNLAAAILHPSSGTVQVLDEQLGKVDVFTLRPRIGYASSAAARNFPANETVINLVMTASYAVTGRWNEYYDQIDYRRAERVLAEWQLTDLADRAYGTLSDGEKKRSQIARAIMTDPELLLLDEPTANLDLGAREGLLDLLSGYARSDVAPAMVIVTHHVEEIPVGFTHALILKDGREFASGPISEIITSETLSRAYDRPLTVTEQGGRFSAFSSKTPS